MERGYKRVTLGDIASALDVKIASLYYHAPGGKQDLYSQVVERDLRKHQEGLARAIRDSGESLEMKLRAITDWMFSAFQMRSSHTLEKRKTLRFCTSSFPR